MSFFHRLIVGHFDIGTFLPHRPVPLRPLDERRTRAMLEEIGERIGRDEYAVDGEPLYLVKGYCDCPWLSNRTNGKSEGFARTLAAVEDCYLIEKGVGTVLNPIRSIQAVPREPRSRNDRRLKPLTRVEAEALAGDDDPEILPRALVEAAAGEGDWVEGFCAGLAVHDHFHVRGNALFALGTLASRKTQLARETIQPILEKSLSDPDPYVSGQAWIAAEAVEWGLHWVIASFDNGEPAKEVPTYANGWVICPGCGLRFATYDPWAFREGRCMTCRQKLTVIVGDA